MVLGGPVVGKEFYDREELIKELAEGLSNTNYSLIGPRGCGKSSLLYELTRRGVKKFVPVLVNVRKIVPKTPRNLIKAIGREALYATLKERGLLRGMPALIASKVAKVVEFVQENLRIKIGDWLTLYFDASSDITELIENTFTAIESYDAKLLVMIDEITGLVKLSGAEPKDEDMDLMWALGEHTSTAKNARYIVSGSQTGIMKLLMKKETGPFVRRFTPKEMGGLEESGAERLIADKIKRRVSENYIDELKERTRLLPLYLQAYCLATNAHKGKLEKLDDAEEEAFGFLYGHFLYLESLLSESELLTLLALNTGGRVSDISTKTGTPYNTLQATLRRLELKGFVRAKGPGSFEALDPIFQKWLAKTYEIGPAKIESG